MYDGKAVKSNIGNNYLLYRLSSGAVAGNTICQQIPAVKNYG